MGGGSLKEAIPTVLIGGITVNRGVISSATRAAEQVLSESGAPVPPGADQVPPGTAGISEPGDNLFLNSS